VGLFSHGSQGLEKLLRLDHRDLAGKDLVHKHAMHFLVRVRAAILEHQDLIVRIGRPPHGRQYHATRRNPQQDEGRHLVRA
jgi:hypothetical protein